METGDETSSVSSEGGEASPVSKTPTEWQNFWTKEMEASAKRLKEFIIQGNKINRRYLDDRSDTDADTSIEFRLNLFHANVSTLMSMLYGRIPKIDVSREYDDPDDDVARVASVLLERLLSPHTSESGDDISPVIRSALQDRLLAGLGTARIRYEYETQEIETIVKDPITQETTVQMKPVVVSERAVPEYVHWQDFRWGWSRTYEDIPWLGYRSWLSRDDATERFGAEIARQLTYKNQVPDGDNKGSGQTDSTQKNNIQQAEIWEIWCKKTKKVYWWSPGAPAIMDIKDDPLELSEFWPGPKPMAANLTTSLYMPKADYTIAQDLYNEIDILQTRISLITKAVKVVGVYDKNSDGLKRMMSEGFENDLIPVDNWAMFAEKGGLKGQVDWFPVETIVGVLETLKGVLNDTIGLLYQVTGMSDILRGESNQYSGVGQEQMKAKFASIRVQALQDELSSFASQLESIKAEVIGKHFDPQQIAKQSSANYLPEFDKNLISPAIDLIKSPDAKWRINIKPESIAMVDYAQLKSERIEFVTAIATFIQSSGALLQTVPQAMPILLEMLKWTMVGFKGADYMEGMLDQAIELAKTSPPQGDQQAQQEQQKEQMAHQMEMQKIQAKMQSDLQVQQAKHQMEMEKMVKDHQAKMAEQQVKSQGDMQKIASDLQADLQLIASKLDADITTEQSQAENAAAEAQVDHENQLVEMELEHIYSLEEIEANAALQARSRNSGTETD